MHPTYKDYYEDNFSRSDSRKRLGIESTKKVLLFFGYVKPYKGVEDLILSFQRIKNQDTVLLVVGKPLDSDIKARIEELASKDPRIIVRLEYIPDNEIQMYFKSADIVVFPFHYTHTSGSVMLALSFGKPMIVPRIPAITEYVDDRMAVFFEPKNKNALEKALIDALHCDLTKKGIAAEIQSKTFSWQKFVNLHIEAYGEAVER